MSLLDAVDIDFDILPALARPVICLGDLAQSEVDYKPKKWNPCPFCNERHNLNAVLYGSLEDTVPTWRVLCGVCGSAGAIGPNRRKAWEFWNRSKAA